MTISIEHDSHGFLRTLSNIPDVNSTISCSAYIDQGVDFSHTFNTRFMVLVAIESLSSLGVKNRTSHVTGSSGDLLTVVSPD